MMDDLMGKLKEMSAQIEIAQRIRTALGNALLPDQQIDISKIVTANKDSFINWIGTDAGRAAVRDFADKFIASK